MNRLKTILGATVLSFGLVATFSSCSDDKKDEPAVPAAKSVAGSYTGDMSCTVMGQESVFEAMTFTVTTTDDATVAITVPTFGNPPMKVPEITVNGVKVSGTDGNYTLAPTEFNGTTADGKAYSGTIKGKLAESKLSLDYSLRYGAMPMPMICSFSAHKK